MLGLPLPSLDTLLSLPLLSLLVLPSAVSNFSWTTSLNLLFFYLAWSSIVWSHQPLYIELFSTLATRVVFYVIPCLFFLVIDAGLPSASVSIKTHGQRALPHRAVRGGQSPTRLLQYLAVCVGNVLLGVALQSLVEYTFINPLKMRSAVKISTALPMPIGLATDLSKAYLIRGPLTYYIHRYLLHSPRRSPTLTRWHKTWQHSLATTLPFSSSYDHPVTYLLHRWLPVYLPALLFRMHILTYLLFLALTGLEEAFAWSGYSILPSKIMLAGMARRTEAHLMSGGKGNFGPFGVMDWLHKSTLGGSDFLDDIQAEAKKRGVKGKAKNAAGKATDAAGDFIHQQVDDDDDQADEGEDEGPGLLTEASNQVTRALRSRK